MFYFVLLMLYLSQIKLHWKKDPVAIESVAFSFSVSCIFNTTFSFTHLLRSYSFISMKFQDFCTGLMFDRGIFV